MTALLYPTTTLHFGSQGHLITLQIWRANEYHTPNKRSEVQSIDNDCDFSKISKRLPVTHGLYFNQMRSLFPTIVQGQVDGKWSKSIIIPFIIAHSLGCRFLQIPMGIKLWHANLPTPFVLQTWIIPQILQLGEKDVCFSKRLVDFHLFEDKMGKRSHRLTLKERPIALTATTLAMSYYTTLTLWQFYTGKHHSHFLQKILQT